MSPFQYWFLCIIVLVCITIVLVRGSMLEKIKQRILKITPKRFEENVGFLMYCSMCLGFWIGIIGIAILVKDTIFLNRIVTAICSGFLVSVLSIYLDRLIFGIDKHNDLDTPEDED